MKHLYISIALATAALTGSAQIHPSNNEQEAPNFPCPTKKGDYCFKNNFAHKIVLELCTGSTRHGLAKGQVIINPGQQECYFDLLEDSHHYTTYKYDPTNPNELRPENLLREGNVKPQGCRKLNFNLD